MRFLFKYLTSTLLRRLTSLDLNRIIYYKLIPLLIQHFQTFLQGKRQAKSQQFVEKCVLRCYQQNGLICKNIKSRNEEIKFIRNLVELTMPYLLPPYTYSTVSKSFLRELFTCCFVFPLVEIATDPLYVNDILMLIFSGQYETPEKGESEQAESNLIEILHNYELTNRQKQPTEEPAADGESPSAELLGVEFHKLLKNPQMLIVFFQYLKEEGSINYLQFILSLESFNEKLFDPEISQNEMKELHADATHIYRSYLLPAGSDYLGIQDEQLLIEMKRILDKNHECIVELRSLKPLLEAYEEIYSKLEQFYYPQFLTSDLYIKMIVGSRLFNFLDECSSERFIFNEENCEELFENNSDVDEDDEEEDVYVDYGIDLIDIMNADSSSTNELDLKESETVRDLSTWKISIDKVDTKIQNTYKYYYVFQIKVEMDSNGDEPTRADELDEKEFGCPDLASQQSWVVERKYEEFYVLDGKLKKFHGNALSRIVGLSSKRTLFKQSLAFLESKKLEFEKYLHELTNIPGLKRSELIYNFLKPPSDSTTQQEDIFHHSKLVDINLRKMVFKTMPAKFSQERGQNLDSFLKNFISSTESQKGKSNVPNLKDIFNYNNESDSPSSEESPEGDLIDFKEHESSGQQASKRGDVFKVHSCYDYLIIILTRICNLKSYGGLVIKLLRVLQPLLNSTIEHIFHLSVRSKVNNLLTRENINKSILFLKATILEMEAKEADARGLTKLEKMRKQKSQDTLRTLQDYFNNFLPAYLSLLNLNNQTGYFLHSVFQYQLLNKQFFYLFFNLLIEDVFPEIVDKKR